jgi:hypothetical protein
MGTYMRARSGDCRAISRGRRSAGIPGAGNKKDGILFPVFYNVYCRRYYSGNSSGCRRSVFRPVFLVPVVGLFPRVPESQVEKRDEDY